MPTRSCAARVGTTSPGRCPLTRPPPREDLDGRRIYAMGAAVGFAAGVQREGTKLDTGRGGSPGAADTTGGEAENRAAEPTAGREVPPHRAKVVTGRLPRRTYRELRARPGLFREFGQPRVPRGRHTMIRSLSKVSKALRLPGAARRTLLQSPGEDARPGRRPAPEANPPPRLDRGRGTVPPTCRAAAWKTLRGASTCAADWPRGASRPRGAGDGAHSTSCAGVGSSQKAGAFGEAAAPKFASTPRRRGKILYHRWEYSGANNAIGVGLNRSA